ncbi:30S ribosomal protein S20 [Exiguobacterium acetylicum]|uniref:30S ribosomal protein S20 n=1 Tax=Exiguobacterium acetylicum TaxID=41170 RepID=UPI000494B81F|nr:30S ribosomal protein S20 [Exiguobacterium acetylicum]
MANIKSAIKRVKTAEKRVKTAEKRRVANVQRKSAMRSAIKAVETFAAEGNKDQAVLTFATASKKIDKAAAKGLIHSNKAGRDKSRLAKLVNAL